MGFMSDTIKNLKKDLKAIDSTLKYDVAAFNRQSNDTIAMQALYNEEKISLQPQNDTYSKKALQAILNIAHLTGKNLSVTGLTRLMGDSGTEIKNNFNYLDEAWVPKIIDDRTYRAGLALKSFLKEILPKADASDKQKKDTIAKLLDFLPFGSGNLAKLLKPDTMLTQLFDMQTLLNARINFYTKVIKEDTLNTQLQYFVTKQNRKELWNEKVFIPSEKIKAQVDTLTHEIDASMSEQKLQDMLKTLDKHHRQVKECLNYNDSWNAENTKKGLPDTITAHLIVFSLANGLQKESGVDEDTFEHIIKDLLNAGINNGFDSNDTADQINVIEVGILKSLESSYTNAQKLISDLAQNISSLQARLQIMIIEKTIPSDFAVDKLEFKAATTGDINKNLSQNTAQRQLLLTKKEKIIKIKASFNASVDALIGDEAFKLKVQEIAAPHNASFDAQLSNIDNVIEKAHVAILANKDDIAKSSASSREQVIKKQEAAINRAYKDKVQAEIELNAATSNKTNIMQCDRTIIESIKQKYQSKIQQANNKVSQLESSIEITQEKVQQQQDIINDAVEKFEPRKKFLKDAFKNLERLKSNIKEATSLYDIADKISASDLQLWLEIKDDHQLLRVHQQYAKENEWGGFNRTFLSTFLLAQTKSVDQQKEEKEDFLAAIKEKVKAIASELSAQKLTSTKHNESPNAMLYRLRAKYQQAVKLKPTLEAELTALQESKAKLQEQRMKLRAAQESELASHKTRIEKAKEYEVQCQEQLKAAEKNHQSAMQAHSLTRVEHLQLDLHDQGINSVQQQITQISANNADHNALSNDKKLALLKQIKEKLKSQQALFEAFQKKQGARRTPPLEVLKQLMTLESPPKADYTFLQDFYEKNTPITISKQQKIVEKQIKIITENNQKSEAVSQIITPGFKQENTLFSSKGASVMQDKTAYVVQAKNALISYRKARNIKYLIKDTLSQFAAVLLGCFGYKTESEIRSVYIDSVIRKLDGYHKGFNTNEDVSAIINKGIKQFTPRSRHSSGHSLKAVLIELGTALERLKNPKEKQQKPDVSHENP